MIKVQINKICAKLIECEPLTAGMIGKTLEVEFSAEWSGLNKIAVFSNGDVTKDLLESQWNGNTITIPHEVLTDPNRIVNFGIYGYTMSGDDIILAIPTKYVPLGRVYVGADPDGDGSTEPSLPVWAQIQTEVDDLDDRVTDLEEHGGGGGIPEAPEDGKQYARQDGEWTEVISGGGGQGWTTAQIDLLEAVFGCVEFHDIHGAQFAAQLINSLRGGVVPEEPITITFDGTTAKISGLNSLNINYSVTTAEIGG